MLMCEKLAIKTYTHVVSSRLCKVKVGPKRLTTKFGKLFSEGPLRLIKRNLLAKNLKPKLVIVVISQLLKRIKLIRVHKMGVFHADFPQRIFLDHLQNKVRFVCV